MLRISEVSSRGEETVLRLEGEIIGPWVDVVKTACEPFLGNGHRLTLDLMDVSHVDREGIALLRELMRSQVILINCSPFLAEQLRAKN
jgi:ABC-type transporter Mla MlaB component